MRRQGRLGYSAEWRFDVRRSWTLRVFGRGPRATRKPVDLIRGLWNRRSSGEDETELIQWHDRNRRLSALWVIDDPAASDEMPSGTFRRGRSGSREIRTSGRATPSLEAG